MKTKNKMLAMLEIAIVLCSVFLVALPCIAADQKQETQKVSASEVTTTASEDDFVLEIYGNANEDECIDMRDYTYAARIICWLEDETTLADANYDGRISVADMTQIGLIILGRESELTFVDSAGISKTFYKPVERIIALDDGNGESLRLLGEEDKVVGVGWSLVYHDIILPEMSKLPIIATGWLTIDYEKVFSLEPDLFFTYAAWSMVLEGVEETLEPNGVQVLLLDCLSPTTVVEDIIKLGYLLGTVDKAEEFAEFHEGYMDKIKSRTEGLSEDEKPRVFIVTHWDWSPPCGMTTGGGTKHDEVCSMAGGINIAHDLESFVEIDPEWVIAENPDIIIGCAECGPLAPCGYGVEDTTAMEELRDEIMNYPGWESIKAVKNGDVYIISDDLALSGLTGFVFTAYCAKWFHPDLFEDLDPETIHQEYVDRFIRIDHDIKKDAFVYPG